MHWIYFDNPPSGLSRAAQYTFYTEGNTVTFDAALAWIMCLCSVNSAKYPASFSNQ